MPNMRLLTLIMTILFISQWAEHRQARDYEIYYPRPAHEVENREPTQKEKDDLFKELTESDA